jgi:ferredoxin--NADP+ reductase
MLPTPAVPESKHVTGQVVSRREVGSGLWIVRIRPAEKVVFLPGQYITAGLPGATRMVERPYSVVSAPHEAELEFFLELVPTGELTPQLYQVPVGGEVQLRRLPKGRFLYDLKSGHPNHFMVATVTGIAPYLSMLRDLVARADRGEKILHRIVVLQGASQSHELGYRDELAQYARLHEWLHYIPTVSRPWLEPAWEGENGRVEDTTRKYLDVFRFTPADTTAYVCGNPNMIENLKGLLRRAGFPKESVKEEVYWHAEKE